VLLDLPAVLTFHHTTAIPIMSGMQKSSKSCCHSGMVRCEFMQAPFEIAAPRDSGENRHRPIEPSPRCSCEGKMPINKTGSCGPVRREAGTALLFYSSVLSQASSTTWTKIELSENTTTFFMRLEWMN
jgi:hypothetical protein